MEVGFGPACGWNHLVCALSVMSCSEVSLCLPTLECVRVYIKALFFPCIPDCSSLLCCRSGCMGGVPLSKDAHGNGHDQVSMVKSLHKSDRPLKTHISELSLCHATPSFPVGLV